MQPIDAGRRLPPMVRLLFAALFALALLGAPTASVHACSCAMPEGPAATIAVAAEHGGLAFMGTVLTARPGGRNQIGDTIRYAFEVERASAATPAVIEVESLDDPGGAACGFAFGIGERWFVATHRDGAVLGTGLCSGNLRLDAGEQPGADGLEELLAFAPSAPAAGEAESEPASLIQPGLLVALVAVAVAGIGVVAFRGGSVRR